MSDAVYVGMRIGSLETAPAFEPISKIILYVDDEHAYEAGNDTGRAMEVTCPYGTQEMANNLLEQLGGYAYQPAQATDALLDPAAELGDAVTMGGVYTVLASVTTTFDSLMTADIGAPGQAEIDSEYPYVSQQISQTNYQIATLRSQITKTSQDITLRVDGLESEYAELKVTIDGVTVSGPGGTTLIKGSSIQTSTLAANSISADALNLTGAITFDDLSSSVQNDINDAYSTAQSAQSEAMDASSQISAWTYPGTTQINGNEIMANTVTASTLRGGTVQLLNNSGGVAGYITLAAATSASYSVQLTSNAAMRITANSGVVWIESSTGAYLNVASNVVVGTNLQPAGDNNYACGVAGARWSDVYSAGGVTTSSDRREKTDIDYDLSPYDDLFDALKPASFKRIDGTSGRTHTGFISQDIGEALEPCGLTSLDFAAYICSPLEDEYGQIYEGEYRYGIRYEELIALAVWRIKKLEARVAALEGTN